MEMQIHLDIAKSLESGLDEAQNRLTQTVAHSPAQTAEGREGAHTARRQTFHSTSEVAMGSYRQGVSIRN